MLLRIGDFEINITLDDAEFLKLVALITRVASPDLLNKLNLSQIVANNPVETILNKISDAVSEVTESEESPEVSDDEMHQELKILKQNGFTDHMIVLISKKVLHLEASRKRIAAYYPDMKPHVDKWLDRPIRETYRFLYVAYVDTRHLNRCLVVIGINQQNNFSILHFHPGSVKKSFESLLQRGLRMRSVEAVVLGTDLDVENEVKKILPKARIQRCWDDVLDRSPIPVKNLLRKIPQASSKAEAQTLIAELDPKHAAYLDEQTNDLLTFFDFDKRYWKPLSTMNCIYRMAEQLNRKLKKLSSEEEIKLVFTWFLLAREYQWRRIPVDSPQLDNLKYKKERGEHSSGNGTSSKNTVRRRPTERAKESAS